MRIKVFVIDDEPSILEAIKDSLPPQEFLVYGAKDPERGLEGIRNVGPDILLLDWNLPGRTGLEVCRLLRADEKTRGLPVIMLTMVDRTASKVDALSAGADDYVTKPFKPEELEARIKAVLRRLGAGVVPSNLIKHGILEINGANYSVKVDGKPVELSTTEFDILYLLASRQNHPLTREVLLDHACPQTTETLRAVDVHILHLRQKLGPKAGAYIKTIHRVGYLFGVPS